MILIISMATLDAYNASDGSTGLKRKFERLAGAPAMSIHYTEASPEYVERIGPKAIFITGFGQSWTTFKVPDLYAVNDLLHTTSIPVYGACGGHQLIGYCFNKDLRETERLEDEPMRRLRPGEPDPGPISYALGYWSARGFSDVEIVQDDPIFEGLQGTFRVSESHFCEVKTLPPKFVHLATSPECRLEMFRHRDRPLYGAQFHAESWVDTYRDGRTIMRNFFRIAGV